MGPLALSFLLAAQISPDVSVPAPTAVSFDVEAATRSYPGFEIESEDRSERQSVARAFVGRAIAKYPAGTLATVFVVKKLARQGAAYGGTANPDGKTIILCVGDYPTINAAWAESALHHEFAHSLMFRHRALFPREAWLAANAQGFQYAHANGLAALKSGETSLAFLSSLSEQGVLSVYGSSSFDEDWACYAQNVLGNSREFQALERRFPRVREKARLTVEFLRKAAPGIRLPDPSE